jgi:hypothetical protein
MDFFHDRHRGRHGEPAAAVLFGDERGQKARLGQRRDEFRRIAALAIKLASVLHEKAGAHRAHILADRRVIGFAHDRISARTLFIATMLRSGTSARKLTTLPSRQNSVRIVSPGNTGAEKRPENEATRAGS